MSTNATISNGNSYRYSPTGAVMTNIKKEYDVPESAFQSVADFNLHDHSAAPVAAYGEGNGTRYVQIPNHYYPSQASISVPLPQKRKAADPCYNPVTTSQHTLEASPSEYPSTSDVKPNSRSVRVDTPRKRSRHRPSRERKTEKKTRNSEPKERTIPLNKALSQIAIEVNFFGKEDPHKEAENHATRSAEERHAEVANNKDNKIKRPLNAFMLYRKVYQKFAKIYCTRDNHQQVSTICGESWTTRESSALIAEYNRLAAIERQNHENAFPDYKYDPSYKKGEDKDKTSSLQSSTTNRGLVNDRGSTMRGRVTRNGRKALKLKKFQHLSDEVLLQAIDEQQPLPAKVTAPLPYWTSPAVQTYAAPYGEDHHVYPDPTPYQTHCITTTGDNYSTGKISPPVVHDLYGDTVDPHMNYYTQVYIDPSLLPCQPSMVYDLTNCSVAIQRQWQPVPIESSRTETVMPSLNIGASHDAYLRGTDQDWKVEQLDEPSQFDDWMAQTEV